MNSGGSACGECGGRGFGGNFAHKATCSLKPKRAAAERCAACGAVKGVRGFDHTPACPNRPVVVVDGLARSIGDVCKTGVPGVLPLRSFAPAQPHVPLASGDVLLKGPDPGAPSSRPVSDAMAERLLTALASAINGDRTKARAVTNRMTIRAFRKLGDGQQLAFINRIWNSITTSHAFDTLGSAMTDPISDSMDGATLPTSVCPVRPGLSIFKKRLAGQPFREHGIGFRVDGSDQSSVDRVLGAGMTQQRLNAGFMLGPRRGLRVDATALMDWSRARCWTGNNDIFNETAVCVSRNFFGGTAFPERETNGTCFLWAVSCSNLLGFDTEGYQLGLEGSRQWRPGEKAFPFIPVSNIVGYLKIDRRGAPRGGGWKVRIPTEAKWNWVNHPNVKTRKYLEEELAAWQSGAEYVIPAAYDFAT